MKDLKNPSLEEVLEYPSLEEVLKAYDIHENGRCEECPYEFDISCVGEMAHDLHKYVMMLKEENKELMVRLFLSEQSM